MIQKEGKKMRKETSRSSRSLIVLALLIAIAGAGTGFYFYKQNQDLKNDPGALQNLQDKEATDLKEKVGKIIDLPKDEKPVVATVKDKSKLKDQPFFDNAKNGDKILIFTQSSKAIIYRESENRLINVGPIAVSSNAQIGAGKNVAFLNGSGKSDANDNAEKKLSATFPKLTVSSKEDAAKSDYSKTQVFDISGQNSDLAKSIATTLGGEVVKQLPSGEKTVDGADIIVVLGQ